MFAIASWWCWATAVASVFVFVVYPQIRSAWALAGAQVAAYALLLAPVGALRPPLRPAGRGGHRLLWTVAGGALLVVAIAAVGEAAHSASTVGREVVKYAATGIGEEVLFRGVIWSLLARCIARAPWLVLADVALFVAWHIPSVLAGDNSWGGLWTVGALGVAFSLARLVSGRIELPVLLHMAVDLLGS